MEGGGERALESGGESGMRRDRGGRVRVGLGFVVGGAGGGLGVRGNGGCGVVRGLGGGV